jgi:hypothetical protein
MKNKTGEIRNAASGPIEGGKLDIESGGDAQFGFNFKPKFTQKQVESAAELLDRTRLSRRPRFTVDPAPRAVPCVCATCGYSPERLRLVFVVVCEDCFDEGRRAKKC